MDRWRVSLTVIAFGFALLLLVAPAVLFVLVGAVLLALAFRSGGLFIARHMRVGEKVGVGLFVVALVLVTGGLGLAFAPAISQQIDALVDELPKALQGVRDRIASVGWLNRAFAALMPENPAETAAPVAARTLSATLAAMGGFVVLLFIALYGALNPDVYRRGFLCLFAPSLRTRTAQVLDALAATLRGWIVARLFSMTVVGVLTTLGLWAAGVPLAPALGLIAALLGFIPNLGPVLAAIPAVLLAATMGGQTVAIVVGLFIAIQAVETYGLTPIVEQREVNLPPAVVLGAQLFMGSLYGVAGLAVASPLAAIALVLSREVYVGDYLDTEGRAERPVLR